MHPQSMLVVFILLLRAVHLKLILIAGLNRVSVEQGVPVNTIYVKKKKKKEVVFYHRHSVLAVLLCYESSAIYFVLYVLLLYGLFFCLFRRVPSQGLF